MPWNPDDADRHTHKATTWVLKELWAKVANEYLQRTGDEGRAMREANAVIRAAGGRLLPAKIPGWSPARQSRAPVHPPRP